MIRTQTNVAQWRVTTNVVNMNSVIFTLITNFKNMNNIGRKKTEEEGID
jgi:hypothetical protein